MNSNRANAKSNPTGVQEWGIPGLGGGFGGGGRGGFGGGPAGGGGRR
jgi:hypothetical protein